MTNEKLYEAIGDISDNKIKEAKQGRKVKQPIWLKWGAMAACLCLVAGLAIPMINNKPQNEEIPPVAEELPPVIDEGPANLDIITPEQVEVIEFNGAEYFICKDDNKDILTECGITTEVTEDMAGEHVCYLEISNEHFVPVEKADASEENAIELFEYAPEPTENIYILCNFGEYFAVVRMDGDGYHGLTD